jgi:hypothetical protein
LAIAAKLQKEHLLEIQDVATVTWPEGKKKPKTHHGQGACGGAWYGAFWGMLMIGFIFFVPFLGAAWGAAMGVLNASWSDYGIGKDFVESVRSKVILRLLEKNTLNHLENFDDGLLLRFQTQKDSTAIGESDSTSVGLWFERDRVISICSGPIPTLETLKTKVSQHQGRWAPLEILTCLINSHISKLESQIVVVSNETDEATSGAGWKIRLSVLCAMLILALAGMGFTQASESGSWEFWLFIVVVYAALSLWRSWQSAKQAGPSVGKRLVGELSHWGKLLVVLFVLLMPERREIVNRDSAPYFALMMLALSCCLAGVHVDWRLLVLGVVLMIMSVAMAMLEQYVVVLWLIMIAVAGVGAAFFYLQSQGGDPKVQPSKEAVDLA